MAILRKQEISKSMGPTIARIKQRDYTIPIRLNQLRLPPSANIRPQLPEASNRKVLQRITNYTKAPYSPGEINLNDYQRISSGSSSNSSSGMQFYKVKNAMINQMISMKATTIITTARWRGRMKGCSASPVPQLSSMVLVLVACATIINTETCYCDTKPSLHSVSSLSSTSDYSNSNSYSSPATTSHKENLLSALSDNIERQHFKIKPARSLIQQRPSKFDSADYLTDLNLDAGIDFIKKKAPTLVSMKKVDDSMRQILRMHEHGAAGALNAAASSSSSSSSRIPVGAHDHQQVGQNSKDDSVKGGPSAAVATEEPDGLAVKRWRKLTGPSNLINSLNPNKVVSKALAYVTPLVSSKLADSTILKSQNFKVGRNHSTNTYSTTLPKIRLHPFVGRSSQQQTSFTKSLRLSFRHPSYTTSSSPQTSSLVRPPGFGDKSDQVSRFNQYSTPLSIHNRKNFNNNRDLNLKTGGRGRGAGGSNSVDSIISDLMADSSDSSIGATIEAASAGISSHLGGNFLPSSSSFNTRGVGNRPTTNSIGISDDGSINGGTGSGSGSTSSGGNNIGTNNNPIAPSVNNPISTTSTSSSSTHQTPPKPHKSAGSRLKKGANQLAQNYFHNIITLSQLPILPPQSSMTSTAPSVLERRRKPNKIDKISGAGGAAAAAATSGGGSKFRRRRLIEDLYRYAYMLSTGVRNKRDPLEALGSSPTPSSLISITGHKKQGVLSQRSINQLMASNRNQMLNYVRRLRSMLTLGPISKAKPRGVMWDMATDPSLALTVFHLIERASVALPLGFLLLPIVQMIRHPLSGLNGLNLGRILPAKASHRSVDIEELAKRLDVVDKMLSRALRSTHRESYIGK